MNKISSTVSIGRTHAQDDRHSNVNVAKEGKSASMSRSNERDDLVLTGAAQQVLNAASLQQSLPDIDQAKVDRIKQAIESNSYQVSAQRIANKLVDMEKL